MNSNYYTYSSEERGGSPADIVTILKNFHASILPSAMSEIPQFEAMSEEFTRPTQSGETTSFVPDWEKFVKSQYPSHPQIAEKVIFLTLAHYFKDDVLRHFLVAGTKADTTRYIALKLLNLEINKWKNDGQSEAEVFKLLELQQPNGNLFEGPIFGKWIEFVQAKYEGQHERYKKMYEVLATHFEVDDLARILVKGAESDVGEEMNGRARSLLDFQVFMWNTLGRDEANVFKLLQLDTTKKPLESPVFSKWAKFVWLRYPKENPDKMILDKLSSIYKSKNALLGGLDTLDRAKASSQDKAAEKILEYQYKQWSNKDAKEVFDILELHRSDSNLLKRRPFPRGSASSRQYRRMV
ncbi:hypothetical protein KXD40_007963 [Peronospora effusa]|nr:hypothetical protein KXD40_007963 [Peronospora effusa]